MSVDAAEIRTRAHRLMTDTRFALRARCVNLWTFVLTNELGRGTQFLQATPGGQHYVVLGHNQQVIQITKRGGDGWHAYFNMTYGFPQFEMPARFIYESLRSYIATNGQKAELRRFSAFDQTTRTTYISAYNGRMFKLDGANGISVLPIGEDGIFFADDDGGVHVQPEIANHGALLDRVTNLNFAESGLGGITPEQQRMAFTVWMFALAFPDLMPTKPLLLLEGVQGAGKTSGVMLLELVLMGHRKAMQLEKDKPNDFGVTLLRRPIAIFDNLDSYVDWVPDAVCAYATGTGWTRRRLYTDDDSFELQPHAFIAVASKNPASFRREDTADRCIILRLEKRVAFRRFERLEREILDDRSLLFGEYLWYCNRIVAELRASAIDDADIEETFRMADFAALARVVGRVLSWPEDAVPDLMLALQRERDAFINESDPLVNLLERWVVYKTRAGFGNVGRMVSALELNAELETLAGAASIPWKYTANALAQKLRSPHVERALRIEASNVNGTKMYRLWRHSDPRIAIIDGGVSENTH